MHGPHTTGLSPFAYPPGSGSLFSQSNVIWWLGDRNRVMFQVALVALGQASAHALFAQSDQVSANIPCPALGDTFSHTHCSLSHVFLHQQARDPASELGQSRTEVCHGASSRFQVTARATVSFSACDTGRLRQPYSRLACFTHPWRMHTRPRMTGSAVSQYHSSSRPGVGASKLEGDRSFQVQGDLTWVVERIY